uniref:Uncharacterized protein n=1 Tax=Tanacetum cinerariifolium TaxID=118510 RepID=A0A699UN85_TANCI|nr:hypothetical protein [Tanacetum cinerariifolium]
MSDLPGILKKIDDALHTADPKISIGATNDHLKDNLPKIISQDLATRVPNMIEDLFKSYASRYHDQDDHPDDNPEGEKNCEN